MRITAYNLANFSGYNSKPNSASVSSQMTSETTIKMPKADKKIAKPAREIIFLKADGSVDNSLLAGIKAKFIRGKEIVHSKFYETFMVPYYEKHHINHRKKLYTEPKKIIRETVDILEDGTIDKSMFRKLRSVVDDVAERILISICK